MDAPEASAGHTLYLPVNVPGALLYMGDGHAAMGDGEVAGTGIEIPMRVRLQVNVIKGKAIRWPRFENEEYIMAVALTALSTMRSASPSRSWSAGCTPTTDFGARRLRAAFKGRKNPSSGDGGPELRGHGQIHKRFLPPPRK